MEEKPLENNLSEEVENPKTKISFPTFNKYTITTLVDGKANPEAPNQPNELELEGKNREEIKTHALTIEENLSTSSLKLTTDLTCEKNLTADKGVFVKNNFSLKPTTTVNINGKLNLLNSTIIYKSATKSFDSAKVSDRKDQEYIPYGELKKYGISFMTRSSWSEGQVGEGGSVYWGQYFSWSNYATINEVKHPNNNEVFQLQSPNGTNQGIWRDYYLTFKKPGIYRVSVAISKHGAWLDNGRGGLNELKVTFENGHTHKIGHMTTAGQTNYNYRSSGIIGAVVAANQPGKFWIECIGPSYRVHMFDWSIIRLPSLQWDP
ncbi:hypothetical protein [Chlamydiifrater phoenicopteri]|uniref:hypothetical protein n=1 Tax=Chlamydiifrater phoenicopteri TaxID=2681469 RepID=UPI001BD0C7F6|nr:hypothetical protein [Chlamydiifrater phoenicopteri]